MGLYPQLKVGVAVGGGGDLQDIESRSLIVLVRQIFHPYHNNAAQTQALKDADPLTYASSNIPRHVLMIQGARDSIMPPRDSLKLWNALGQPPIQWADMGHVGLGFSEMSEYASGYAYFIANWATPGTPDPPIPQVNGPTLKLGFLALSDSRPLFSLQDQVLAFGHKPDHTSVFGLNVGVTTSRPFAALSYTVTHFIDVGVAMRASDHKSQAYVGVYFPL
jgi:hypothetical protein